MNKIHASMEENGDNEEKYEEGSREIEIKSIHLNIEKDQGLKNIGIFFLNQRKAKILAVPEIF